MMLMMVCISLITIILHISSECLYHYVAPIADHVCIIVAYQYSLPVLLEWIKKDINVKIYEEYLLKICVFLSSFTIKCLSHCLLSVWLVIMLGLKLVPFPSVLCVLQRGVAVSLSVRFFSADLSICWGLCLASTDGGIHSLIELMRYTDIQYSFQNQISKLMFI